MEQRVATPNVTPCARPDTAPVAEPAVDVGVASYTSPEIRRVLANMRVLVAIFAIAEVLSLSSSLPSSLSAVGRGGAMTYAALGYAAYAGWLCWIEFRGDRLLWPRLIAWVDVAWILTFAWLAAMHSSLLMLLFFPVLFAAVSFGFLSGLLVSLIAAALTAAQMMVRVQDGVATLPEAMQPPLLILVFGPVVAALACVGMRINEQMTIAERLLARLDPRLGVARMADTLLRTLAPRFAADRGWLLIWLPGSEARLFRVGADGSYAELHGELHATLIDALGRLPATVSAAHQRTARPRRWCFAGHVGLELVSRRASGAARVPMQQLAELLEARSLLALPICRRSPHPNWLVLDSRHRRYRSRDLELLSAVMEPLGPLIENAGLLECLADEAMATERARIGRDLHDTAIQPYLGLKYGIEALARKAAPDNPLRADILTLQEVTVGELHNLRELVSGMRSGTSAADNALAPALQRQASRFTELFGLDVVVRCDAGLSIGRRLAAAIFPIVGEALTNIRRHTAATAAQIIVHDHPQTCELQIRNAHDPATAPAAFMPRSIAERVHALHGSVRVELQQAGFTDLIISIPKGPAARASAP